MSLQTMKRIVHKESSRIIHSVGKKKFLVTLANVYAAHFSPDMRVAKLPTWPANSMTPSNQFSLHFKYHRSYHQHCLGHRIKIYDYTFGSEYNDCWRN